VTSHRLALGSLASEASRAASRRTEGMRFERAAAGEMEVLDMALCVARFGLKWNQLGVKKPP
jgi:hypothetical protein